MNRRTFLTALPVLAFSAGIISRLVPERGVAGAFIEDDEWNWWRNLPRTLLSASDDPFAAALIRAAARRSDIRIVYSGGSEGGGSRVISPLGVFTVEGYQGVYVSALCHRRNAERVFRLDRIEALA